MSSNRYGPQAALLGLALCAVYGTQTVRAEDDADGTQKALGKDVVKFDRVRLRYKKSVDKIQTEGADLIFDTKTHRMRLKCDKLPLDLDAEHIRKITYEYGLRRRRSSEGELAGVAVFGGRNGGGLLGALLTVAEENSVGWNFDWCKIDYLDSAGAPQACVLMLRAKESDAIVKELKALAGEKLTCIEHDVAWAKIDRDTIREMALDIDIQTEKDNETKAVPETKADMALVIVVWPGEYAYQTREFRLFCDGELVAAMRRQGRSGYCAAYLKPGEHVISVLEKHGGLITIGKDSYASTQKLEAGQCYSFLFFGEGFAMRPCTREIALHEISGARYATFTRKDSKSKQDSEKSKEQ
ncbi:MAG: hypothetical protein ABSE73_20875 [Planctomycetota bacterium]